MSPVQLGSAQGLIKIGYDGAGISQALAGLGGLTNTLEFVGNTIEQYVIQPLVQVGGVAVGMAADFESQLKLMELAAGDVEGGFETLHDAAITVGGDTRLVGISASEAAEAMTNFYKAGLDTTDIFSDLNEYMEEGTELSGALRAAIDLAAASELNLGQASDVVAVAMATFGLEADQATAIANSFVQAADASVTEVDELAMAMVNVGPTAASFGWTLEDTNTALAILSERGIRGAEAGTALKSMMTNIMRPTEDVQAALKELNVSLYDTDGTMRNLPDIIADFERALAGGEGAVGRLTEKQRNQYVQTLAGTFGMKAFNTLLAEGAEGWNEMTLGIEGAATAQDVGAVKAASFQGVMESLEGTVETFAISAGGAMLPILSELGDWAADFVSTHGPAVIASFSGFVAIVSDLARYLLAVLEDGDFLNDWLSHLPTGIQPVVEAGGRLIAFLRDLVSGLVGWDYPWEDIFGPEVAAVIYSLVPVIQQIVEFVGNNLQPILIGLAAVAAAVVIPAIVGLVSTLVSVLAPVLAIGGAVAVLAGIWQRDWMGIRTTLTEVWTTKVLPILRSLWLWLQTNVPKAIQTLTRFWRDTLMPILRVVWDFVANYLIPLYTDLAGLLVDVVGLAVTVLAGLWQNVLLPAIRAVWQYVANTFQPGLSALWKFFREKLMPVLEVASAYLGEDVYNAFVIVADVVDALRTGSIEPLGHAFEWIKNKIKDAIDVIARLRDKLANIDIPDWLKPGSPPPLAYAFADIADAMRRVSAVELPRLAVGLNMSTPGMGMGATRLQGSNGTVIEVHGGIHLHGVRDEEDMLARLQRLVVPGGIS